MQSELANDDARLILHGSADDFSTQQRPENLPADDRQEGKDIQPRRSADTSPRN